MLELHAWFKQDKTFKGRRVYYGKRDAMLIILTDSKVHHTPQIQKSVNSKKTMDIEQFTLNIHNMCVSSY